MFRGDIEKFISKVKEGGQLYTKDGEDSEEVPTGAAEHFRIRHTWKAKYLNKAKECAKAFPQWFSGQPEYLEATMNSQKGLSMIQDHIRRYRSGTITRIFHYSGGNGKQHFIAYVDSNGDQLIDSPDFVEVSTNYETPSMLYASGKQKLFCFKLFARKCNTGNTAEMRNQSALWFVDSEKNRIMKYNTRGKATISGSCSIVERFTDNAHPQIKVAFKRTGKIKTFKNRYFRKDQNTIEFLKLLQAIGESKVFKTKFGPLKHNWKTINPKELFIEEAQRRRMAQSEFSSHRDSPVISTDRRRMAQREFSSRRDSPVMVRLLEEIVAAQDD